MENHIIPLESKRIIWVDLAKSFGLFLVFWGHTLYGGSHIADIINRAIYSFHMPLFFILSGYVTKHDKNQFCIFVKKKIKRIVFPALVLYVLALPVFLLLFIDLSNLTFDSFVVKFLYIYGECLGNKPVWFFFCYFQIILLVKIFDLPKAPNSNLIVVCVFSLLLSYLFYKTGYRYFKLLGFDKCVIGLFFYVFGIILRNANYHKYIFKIGFVCLPIWVITGIILNTKVRMYDMYLGNYWFFVLSGITGTLFFFSLIRLFEFLKDNTIIKIIMEYAKWTVFVVSSHYVLTFIFHLLFEKLALVNTYIYDIISFCFVLLALVIYYPMCKWIEKHVPILI